MLSKTAISKMEREPTTLPHDDNTEALSLLRLFHNPDWTVSGISTIYLLYVQYVYLHNIMYVQSDGCCVNNDAA